MSLDIVKYRNDNNIFGTDLWGKGVSGEGLYSRILGSQNLYDVGHKQKVQKFMSDNNVTEDVAEAQMNAAKPTYLHQDEMLYTNPFASYYWRLNRGLPPKDHKVTRAEVIDYFWKQPPRRTRPFMMGLAPVGIGRAPAGTGIAPAGTGPAVAPAGTGPAVAPAGTGPAEAPEPTYLNRFFNFFWGADQQQTPPLPQPQPQPQPKPKPKPQPQPQPKPKPKPKPQPPPPPQLLGTLPRQQRANAQQQRQAQQQPQPQPQPQDIGQIGQQAQQQTQNQPQPQDIGQIGQQAQQQQPQAQQQQNISPGVTARINKINQDFQKYKPTSNDPKFESYKKKFVEHFKQIDPNNRDSILQAELELWRLDQYVRLKKLLKNSPPRDDDERFFFKTSFEKLHNGALITNDRFQAYINNEYLNPQTKLALEQAQLVQHASDLQTQDTGFTADSSVPMYPALKQQGTINKEDIEMTAPKGPNDFGGSKNPILIQDDKSKNYPLEKNNQNFPPPLESENMMEDIAKLPIPYNKNLLETFNQIQILHETITNLKQQGQEPTNEIAQARKIVAQYKQNYMSDSNALLQRAVKIPQTFTHFDKISKDMLKDLNVAYNTAQKSADYDDYVELDFHSRRALNYRRVMEAERKNPPGNSQAAGDFLVKLKKELYDNTDYWDEDIDQKLDKYQKLINSPALDEDDKKGDNNQDDDDDDELFFYNSDDNQHDDDDDELYNAVELKVTQLETANFHKLEDTYQQIIKDWKLIQMGAVGDMKTALSTLDQQIYDYNQQNTAKFPHQAKDEDAITINSFANFAKEYQKNEKRKDKKPLHKEIHSSNTDWAKNTPSQSFGVAGIAPSFNTAHQGFGDATGFGGGDGGGYAGQPSQQVDFINVPPPPKPKPTPKPPRKPQQVQPPPPKNNNTGGFASYSGRGGFAGALQEQTNNNRNPWAGNDNNNSGGFAGYSGRGGFAGYDNNNQFSNVISKWDKDDNSTWSSKDSLDLSNVKNTWSKNLDPHGKNSTYAQKLEATTKKRLAKKDKPIKRR